MSAFQKEVESCNIRSTDRSDVEEELITAATRVQHVTWLTAGDDDSQKEKEKEKAKFGEKQKAKRKDVVKEEVRGYRTFKSRPYGVSSQLAPAMSLHGSVSSLHEILSDTTLTL